MTEKTDARTMSDAEFETALARKAWRGPPAAPPPIAVPGSASPAPAPPPAQLAGVKPAMQLSEDEFDAAFRAKAWRHL